MPAPKFLPAAGGSENNRAIRLLPAGRKFQPLAIYELWYDATAPKVVGMGLAATRDFVSFLRFERADPKGTANPALGGGGDPPGRAMRSCSASPRAAASCATSSNSA